jgi:isopenicillin-N epimerase
MIHQPTHNPPPPLAPDLRSLWSLRPDLAFLNHGSFGAVPKPVAAEQERWRNVIEAEPVERLWRSYSTEIANVRERLGAFLHTPAHDFGLVTNATEGVNAVLQSLHLSPGDELLTTNHVYNAVRQAMLHTARRHHATYREIELRTPIQSAQQITDTILNTLTDRTRILVIDHVTSPTALIFPVQQIVAAAAKRSIDILVDGAHAPGMLDLDVPAIDAAYYTGNLHKWVSAPRGAAFLYVAPHRQPDVHPLSVSHDYGKGFAKEFDWQGTRDVTPWLTIPAAIDFFAQFGWPEVRHYNHSLAVWANQFLCDRWNVESLSPTDGALLGCTATIPLPGKLGQMGETEMRAFQRRLYDEDRIEVPFVPWQGACHIRVSCHIYNTPTDYERLANAINRRARG